MTATISLWTGAFRDGISSTSDESYAAVTWSSLPRLWERDVPRVEGDCWVGEATILRITTLHNHSFGQNTGMLK
jgi:hypothetical protein